MVQSLFDLAVLFGASMLAVDAVPCIWPRRRQSATTLWLMVVTVPLGFLATAFGWMVDKLGRQPYIL